MKPCALKKTSALAADRPAAASLNPKRRKLLTLDVTSTPRAEIESASHRSHRSLCSIAASMCGVSAKLAVPIAIAGPLR